MNTVIFQDAEKCKTVMRWHHEEMIFFKNDYCNWYLYMTAITYLLPALMQFLQEEMEKILDDVVKQFGRPTLCPEATTDDLKFEKGAEFKHGCSGTPFHCNTLLAIIKQETQANVDFIAMLKGTDPQSWLTSPFEFSKLFLDEWTRSKLTGFDDYDITAIGQLARRSKRLKQTFDKNGFSYLLNARNEAMHSPTIEMFEQELVKNVDAMLSFLNQDPLNGRSEVVQASVTIEKLLDEMDRETQNLEIALNEFHESVRNFGRGSTKQPHDESKINDWYSAKFQFEKTWEWLLSEPEGQFFLGVLTGGIFGFAASAMYRGDGAHGGDICSRRCIEKDD